VQFAPRAHDVAQRAINPEANRRRVLEGFNVNIGGPISGCLSEQGIDHPDDGRVVLGLEQIFDTRQVLHQTREIQITLNLIHHRGGRAFLLCIGGRDRSAQLCRGFANRNDPGGQCPRELGECVQRRVLANPDLDLISRDPIDQHLMLAGKGIRHIARSRYLTHRWITTSLGAV